MVGVKGVMSFTLYVSHRCHNLVKMATLLKMEVTMVQKLLVLALIGLLSFLTMPIRAQTVNLSSLYIKIGVQNEADPFQSVVPDRSLQPRPQPQRPQPQQWYWAPAPIPDQQSTRGGPSFDCRRASNTVETLICRDPGLAALDVTLARTYSGVIARLPPNARLGVRQDEARWIAQRAQCASDPNVYACVTSAYSRRIQELNAY